jgi:signal transduction histidine kinase
MLKSRLIILAWLLLLVPTLLLGVGALRLLQSEEARLLSSQRAAASDRASAIAANFDLAIDEVQDGLQGTLRRFAPEDLAQQLHAWKRSNPLVRNIFVWQQGRGLLDPNPEQPASDEESAFVRRYLPLFADQSNWQAPPSDQASAVAAPRTILAERRELSQLAKQLPPSRISSDMASSRAYEAVIPATAAPVSRPVADAGTGSWRSWYADDQLHLLGWFAPSGTQLRYGIEVEMMALLSRLLGNLSYQAISDESYALLDGNGDIFHQVGSFEVLAATQPLAVSALHNLPHWQVAIYSDPQAANRGHGIMLFGSLLIGTFTLSILLGGALLLWQAHRNQRDASQKTSFVSNVSHELKTPLTTIRMYAELLAEGNISDAAKCHRYLQTIVKESQRLTRLVNNVLDFSRLERKQRRYHQEPLDLKELLADLLEAQKPRLADAGIQLQLELPSGPCPLSSDRDALEQIILNLLDNGIKYAAQGQAIQLHLRCDEQQLHLRLRDWGPGIPDGHRQRIFDKFHRCDNSLTTCQQGSGLGLSIARQLAQGLGGQLEYCPVEGSGSCFILSLPLEGKIDD